MKYEDLPPNIQELIGSKSDGEIAYRRPPNESPQPFVRLEQICSIGLLTHYALVQPTDAWLYSGGLPKIGYGQGFSALEERLILADITNAEEEPRSIHEYPLDPTLDFYEHSGPDFYAVTNRVFDLLREIGCIGLGMWCDVFHSTVSGIESTQWKFVDFPKAPIVDYSRSAADWKIHSIGNSKTATAEPASTRIFWPRLTGLPGEVSVRSDGEISLIVRDAISPHYLFIERKTLQILRENNVRGPNYSHLGTT